MKKLITFLAVSFIMFAGIVGCMGSAQKETATATDSTSVDTAHVAPVDTVKK